MSACPSCTASVIPGSLFCDGCGAAVLNVQVARKLRQQSFDTIKTSTSGLLAPGEKLKHRWKEYIVEESIARSGFGATFRATKPKDNTVVLIKQMLEQSSYDQFKKQLLNSFKREAKFIRKIRHPAFPRGFDYFEKNKSFYLIMEFINGKELTKALDDYRAKEGDIPDGLLIFLGIEIAEALDVIHGAGYIYRDLKPQNVMLDGVSGRIKLIDFGTLYKPSDKEPLLFESEGYTPPEFLNAGEVFKPSGDIYSLGALLYEAATNQTPSGPGDTSLLNAGKRDARLVEIIKKCLNLDPNLRYEDAGSLIKDLKSLTRKGFWPFSKRKAIETVELSVLPKTLYPSSCTFCEFCGFADESSQIGYCENCRVPLRVGSLSWQEGKVEREFFLHAKETTLGRAKENHIPFEPRSDKDPLAAKHAKIYRIGNSLYLEILETKKGISKLNRRRVIGPVELLEGDTIEIGGIVFKYTLRNAC